VVNPQEVAENSSNSTEINEIQNDSTLIQPQHQLKSALNQQ